MLPQQPSERPYVYSYDCPNCASGGDKKDCGHDTTDDDGGMQGEVDRLRRREAQLERECERLKSYFGKIKSLLVPVLCDPEGYVCLHGSITDKEEIQKALAILEREA